MPTEKTDPTTMRSHRLTRRAFLQDGSLLLLGAGLAVGQSPLLAAEGGKRLVRVGLMTDLHYADKPPAGTRHYRETLAKLAEAAEEFDKARPEVIVELGDLIDAAGSLEDEKKYLDRIQTAFQALPGEKHYVLGNHCVSGLSKEEFLDGVGQPKPHYSFDAGGIHFTVLDACFRADGESYGRNNFRWNDANIPQDQLEWLQADLQAATGKAIVLVHQRLDVQNDYGIKNAAQVRRLLERSGNVLAVLQGHSHKNDLKDINGIHYCTLVAMVEGSGAENSGYSVMDVFEDGTIRLMGFRNQASYEWE